jgi:hypothetical protein
MSEKTRVAVVNVSIVVALIGCYLWGYPLKIILGCGIFLLIFANVLMYLKRRQISK